MIGMRCASSHGGMDCLRRTDASMGAHVVSRAAWHGENAPLGGRIRCSAWPRWRLRVVHDWSSICPTAPAGTDPKRSLTRDATIRVPRRQRGRRPRRLRAERGDLDLPDHPRLADGGALRRLVGGRAAEPVGQGPGRRRDAVRGGRRRRAPRRPPEGRPGDDVHGQPGPPLDDPQHVQDRRRADADGDPRRGPDHRHACPLDLRRPQRRHARADDRLGDAGGGSVQEAHDFALVAHAATLRARIPFLHFFDGFRTSHEINKIALLEPDDFRALVRDDDVLAFRGRGMTPDAPVVRGTAQNPDVFFQGREASNPFHQPSRHRRAGHGRARRADRPAVWACRLPRRPGRGPRRRRHGLGGGRGRGDGRRTHAAGERVGLVRIRLFHPFPAAQLLAALPPTVTPIAVLDRTKEPGAVGEPLYLEVVAALSEAMDGDTPPFATAPRVIGGRYGLSSKEMTPSMIKPIYEELAAARPKRHFTVGIYDDVTHLSLPIDAEFRTERPAGEVQAVFFGLGSDGTVGANKASVKIIGESTDLFAQGYFVYDSKKSGSVTVSHLRFGPEPIRSTYLVEEADFVACHQFGLLGKTKALETARHGRDVPAQRPVRPGRGLGSPAGWRPAAARRQGHRLLGDRCARRRRRGRDGQPDQHGHATVLLPARGHPAAGRGHHPDQGVRREDVRQARRGGRRAQLRRHRPIPGAPRPRPSGQGQERPSDRPPRCPTTRPISSPGSHRV